MDTSALSVNAEDLAEEEYLLQVDGGDPILFPKLERLRLGKDFALRDTMSYLGRCAKKGRAPWKLKRSEVLDAEGWNADERAQVDKSVGVGEVAVDAWSAGWIESWEEILWRSGASRGYSRGL